MDAPVRILSYYHGSLSVDSCDQPQVSSLGLGSLRWDRHARPWDSAVGRLAVVRSVVPGSVSRNFTGAAWLVIRDVCDLHSKLAGVCRCTPGSVVRNLVFVSLVFASLSMLMRTKGGSKTTMKAIVMHGYRAVDQLRYEEVPTPKPGPDEVLVKVAATSVNPIDSKIRRGDLRSVMPLQFPVIPGRDVPGEIVEIGARRFSRDAQGKCWLRQREREQR